MTRIAAAAAIIAVASLATGARADGDDNSDDGGRAARVAYVARALAAMRSLAADGRQRLAREVYAGSRARCGGDAGTLPIACLVETGRAACAAMFPPPRLTECERVADLVAVNLRGVDDFVAPEAQAQRVAAGGDYHAALAAELHRSYAALAAELALTAPPSQPAAAIVDFCAERDRAVHACRPGDPVCVHSVPWSRCVAAVVWFVGGGG